MRTCDVCNESMDDGWTSDCGSVYVCSKKCMQDRLVLSANITEERAKEVLALFYEDDFEEDDITDGEWYWLEGLFWTEWYDDDDDDWDDEEDEGVLFSNAVEHFIETNKQKKGA